MKFLDYNDDWIREWAEECIKHHKRILVGKYGHYCSEQRTEHGVYKPTDETVTDQLCNCYPETAYIAEAPMRLLFKEKSE